MTACRSAWRLLTLCSATLVAVSARADVIDIGADGTVTRVTGPAVIYSTNLRETVPIQPAVPAYSPPSPSRMAGLAIPPSDIRRTIGYVAQAHQLPADLLTAIAWQESRFQPRALSPKGALGVMQLMPNTARALGVDPNDVVGNITGGARLIRSLLVRYQGNTALALAAYNAGAGAVDRYGGIPPYAETQDYVRAVLNRMRMTRTGLDARP